MIKVKFKKDGITKNKGLLPLEINNATGIINNLNIKGNSYQEQTTNIPSPDYPSPIQNVTNENNELVFTKDNVAQTPIELNTHLAKLPNGSYDELIVGKSKNLFNFDGVSNITIANFNNGIATLNWSSGFECFMLHNGSQYITNLSAEKTYTVSFKHKGNRVTFKDYITNTSVITSNSADYTTYSFTITGITQLRLDVIRTDATGTANIKEVQIEEGDTATSYVPYQEEGTTVVSRVGKVVLNGSEEWEDMLHKYNGLTNGDFSSDLDDWTVYLENVITTKYFDTSDFVKGTQSRKIIFGNGGYHISRQPFTMISGHKYYVRCYIKNSNTTAGDTASHGVRVYRNTTTAATYFLGVTGVNSWTLAQGIFTANGTETHIGFIGGYNGGKSGTMWWDDIICVDLTALGLDVLTMAQLEALNTFYLPSTSTPNTADDIRVISNKIQSVKPSELADETEAMCINEDGDLVVKTNRVDNLTDFKKWLSDDKLNNLVTDWKLQVDTNSDGIADFFTTRTAGNSPEMLAGGGQRIRPVTTNFVNFWGLTVANTTDIYYNVVWYKKTSTRTAQIVVGNANPTTLPNSENFTLGSTRGTNLNRNTRVEIWFTPGATDPTGFLDIKYLKSYNLTAIFGAGNEPSKATLDSMFIANDTVFGFGINELTTYYELAEPIVTTIEQNISIPSGSYQLGVDTNNNLEVEGEIEYNHDYIDINEDSYAELTNDYKLFTDNFYLGSTASNTFKLSVAKSAVSNHPTEVKIEDSTNNYYLIVDKIYEEKNFYVYDLVDKLVLFNFNYNAKPLIDLGTTTLSDILADMCTQAGVTIDETLTLINNIEVTWYDNTLLARDYLSFIAELQGGYAKILDNGKLTIAKHKTTSKATIQIDACEDFLLGERKQITRVVYDNGIAKYEYGLDSGNTLYINPNNVFITDTETVLNIYNEVVGLEFYLIQTGKCQLDPDARAGDIITFTDGTNSYQTIAGYSASYGGGYWLGNYSFDLESKQQEETQTIGIDTKLLSIKTTINRAEAEITTIASRVDEAEEEITTVTQRVDGVDAEVAKITPLQTKTAQLTLEVGQLRSEIGDVTDITTQEEGSGELLFENINGSEPINITIRPTSAKDISYIYPSSALFPSSTLFPQNRILRFYNSTTDETFDYTLPGNLRYYDADNYDEFILDFATATCKIIRKIDISASMVKTLKETPVEETFTYPNIPLSAGNYTVTMPSYPNAYKKIRLMSQNMYTSQFATRVELSSEITQKADEINLEVAKKTDKTAIISTINQTAEAIKIQASKIDITGTLTAINNDTSTTINGNKITTGSITASQVSSQIITTTNFSAQNINADKINGGTISGSSINLGSGKFTVNTSGVMSATGATISGTITANSGTIAGLTISSTELSNANAVLRNNGTMVLYPQVGSGGYYAFNNGCRINVTAGIGIASNSNGSVSLAGGNLDLKACSGSTAYLACMIKANGTGERSAVECANGTMYLRSTGAIYANSVLLASGSSKNMKKNIKELKQKEINLLYKEVEKLPLYKYNYKKEYSGQKNNYGIIIEDFENNVLGKILHVVQNKNDKNMKNYSNEDLNKVNLILIKELMKKIEKLEEKDGKTNKSNNRRSKN